MTTKFRILLLTVSMTFAVMRMSAEVIVPVSTADGLQQAINSATEGSVIELAGGTYAAPNGSFTLYNPTAGFTIRAAAGASVTLNGGGGTDILRYTNSQKPITFQGISFLNGVSNTNFIGGAMTLDNVEAIFISCTFQNNAANGSSTGGGGLWLNAAKVLFQSCNFTGNSSPNYGAAFSALNSQVFINNSRFSGNRANLANHHANSAGGAINANGCLLRIENCRFDNNQAGLVGGAIYAYGPWKDPLTTPVTTLIVSNSTFTGNLAVRGSGGPVQSPAIGGAVFAEDQTTAQFFNCRFTSNSARLGGALASYRAIIEVVGYRHRRR
jgi:predicted outer membrane repeat protein